MKEQSNNHKNGNGDNATATVVTFLNKDQINYLDKIGKDCFFKFGYKISRAKILSELVDLLMHLKIDIGDIDFESESLQEGLIRLMKNENSIKL